MTAFRWSSLAKNPFKAQNQAVGGSVRAKKSVSRRATNWTATLSILLCAATGVILLFLAHTGWKKDLFPYCSELLRDIGIAFIVASVVTVVLEIRQFVRHQFGAMREMFDLIMSERITSDVWLELKDLIEKKVSIRKNVHIRLAIAKAEGVPEHLRVLSIEYGYAVHSLVQKPTIARIGHELDYQFRHEDLPRFTRLNVDTPNGPDNDLDQALGTDKVDFRVRLTGVDGPPAYVQVDRKELVPVPGSYNLYTPDFMKGLTVVVVDRPADVEVEVLIRPQGVGESLRRTGDTWRSEELMLPGQGIEVKFLVRANHHSESSLGSDIGRADTKPMAADGQDKRSVEGGSNTDCGLPMPSTPNGSAEIAVTILSSSECSPGE